MISVNLQYHAFVDPYSDYVGVATQPGFSHAIVDPLPRAKGFDTSYHNHGNADNQKPIDFQAAYDSGMSFWIGRITRGADYIDPWIVRDFIAAGEAGLVRMVYHVLIPGVPNDKQVANLIRGLAQLPAAPAAIAFDLERGGESGKFIVTDCLRYHVLHTPVWPIRLLYSNLNYLQYYITDTLGLPVWISWPAPGGAYNYNDNPPLDDWLMYQRTYCEPVPGCPDLTVDQDEFNGTVEEMRAYFGVTDPEPEPLPGDDMTAIDDLKACFDKLTVMADDLQGVLVSMNDALTRLGEGTPPPPPPPPPEPTRTWTYQVTEDKAIAHYYNRKNAADKPIMVMIPIDERTGYPFKNTIGHHVEVIPGRVDADGPVDYFMIYGTKRKGTGQDLYLSAADGKIV